LIKGKNSGRPIARRST